MLKYFIELRAKVNDFPLGRVKDRVDLIVDSNSSINLRILSSNHFWVDVGIFEQTMKKYLGEKVVQIARCTIGAFKA